MAAKRLLEPRSVPRLIAAGPITLLTTMYHDQPNIMTAGWILPLGFDPPLIGVAVHPGRLTHEFLTKSETFALNIPTVDLISAVHLCGMISGRDRDKFEATELEVEDAAEIEAPLIASCVANIECGVMDRVSWSDHDLFIGRVLRVQADEEAFGDIWNVETDAGRVLHHLGGDRYAGLERAYRASAPEEE